MGKSFRNIHLCSTNDFPAPQNEKIKGWVEHAGGTFNKEISKDFTHLVASPKAWKRYHPLGRSHFSLLPLLVLHTGIGFLASDCGVSLA